MTMSVLGGNGCANLQDRLCGGSQGGFKALDCQAGFANALT